MGLRPGLLVLLVREEYRAQSSMFRSSFLAYPIAMLAAAFLLGMMLPPLLTAMPAGDLAILGHAGVFAAGLLVGGFAMFQDPILERRLGGVRLLLGTPATLPISYKEIFAYFYAKDILYYLAMNILPVLLGAYASTIATGLHIDLPLAAVTLTAAFLMGVSAMFALTTVLVRSRAALATVVVATVAFLALLAVRYGILNALGMLVLPAGSYNTHTWTGALAGYAVFAALSAFSLLAIRERPSPGTGKRYASRLPAVERRFAALGKYGTLAAKEWVDLVRSGSLGYVLLGFLVPLLFLWGFLWAFPLALTFYSGGASISLRFNTVFYAVVIGLFASELYGWLNRTDTIESYATLPVRLSDVIKAKFIVFMVLDAAVSTVYLALICMSRGEYGLFLPALYTMLAVSAYVAAVIAYLTGVATNSMLFDYRVLAAYWLAVAPVLVILIITTYSDRLFVPGLAIATIAGLAAIFLLGRIERKWGRGEFRS